MKKLICLVLILLCSGMAWAEEKIPPCCNEESDGHIVCDCKENQEFRRKGKCYEFTHSVVGTNMLEAPCLFAIHTPTKTPQYITHSMKGKVYQTDYGYVNDRSFCYYSKFADCKKEKISYVMFDDIAGFGFSGVVHLQGDYPLDTEVILELKIKKGGLK